MSGRPIAGRLRSRVGSARRRTTRFLIRLPHHALTFAIRLGWLGLFTVLAFLLASVTEGAWHETIGAIAEALLVATVVSLVVEPFAHARFATHIAEEVLWAQSSPDAPAGHRAQVQALMNQRVFYQTVNWDFEFSPDPKREDLVQLTIKVATNAITYAPEGYRPEGTRYLLASSDGRQSEYLEYLFSAGPGLNVHLTPDRGRDIGPYIEPRADGGIIFDEGHAFSSRIPTRAVRAGDTFSITRCVRVFRHRRGFFPLANLHSVEEANVFIHGPVADSLRFRCLDAVTGDVVEVTPNRSDALHSLSAGSMIIVSWAPGDAPDEARVT